MKDSTHREYGNDFQAELLREVRRRLFNESVPRLKKCLAQLTEEEIWRRPNEHSNSVGNLVLHLCGNARQWILSGLDKQADKRERQQEFDQRDPIPVERLITDLDQLMMEIEGALTRIKPEELLQLHRVQVFEETGISILVHVVEHFSYHVGQVTYYIKAMKDMDMGYYSGMDLEKGE